MVLSNKNAKEAFIPKASALHNAKYTYENTMYANNSTKVSITCPEHGDFLQTPANHLKGKGCPKCCSSHVLISLVASAAFVPKAQALHNFKYDYGKVIYINNATKVRIACPEHGEFLQRPADHLSGNGCPNCGPKAKKAAKAKELFAHKSAVVHNSKYTYENTNYITAILKVHITCPIHGDFQQTPNAHLGGRGCQQCMKNTLRQAAEIDPYSGWRLYYKDRPTTLYYVRFTYNRKHYYKIGITTKTVAERFAKEPIPYTILYTKLYNSGELAYKMEQAIIRKYAKHKYIGPFILVNGNSELFTKDIMKGEI